MTGFRLSRCFLVIVLSTLALIPAACSGRQDSAPKLQQVSVATSTNVWCALPLIAKDRGFFEEEGIDAQINIQDGGRYCMDALLSNSVNFGNVVEINVSYLGFTGNEDISVVANVVTSTSMAIVAWKSSGVEKPSDLVGKRFGFTPGTQGEIFAYRFFDKHLVKPDSLQLRKLQPKAIPTAVAAHEVDAVSTWEPFVNSCLKAMGDQAVVFRDPEAHTGYMHLAVRRDWAQRNPEAVKAFLKALKKAETYAAEHPAEAQAILAREMHLDIETVQAIWGAYEIRLTMDKDKLVDVTTDVGKWIRQTQDNYREKPLPDYRHYFDDTFFKQAVPQ